MSIRQDAFDLAVLIGQRFISEAEATTSGFGFANPSEDEKSLYTHDLYQGSSGVGLTALDLFRATNSSAHADLARRVGYGLIESEPKYDLVDPGLFSGQAGIGLYYLTTARVLRDPFFLKAARRIADKLSDIPFNGTDIISGAAGTGMFFLSMYFATQDTRYLDAGRRTVHYLNEKAEPDGDAFYWAPLGLDSGERSIHLDPHTGLAHGVAGVCLFLIEAARVTQENLPRYLYYGGMSWLKKWAVHSEEGINWPRSFQNKRLQAHWCHGATGIAQAYLAFYRETGDQEALDIAIDAGRTTLAFIDQEMENSLIHCHGLAGAIELFLDLEMHGAGKKWLHAAEEQLPRFFDAVHSKKNSSDSLPSGASLSVGRAGIVRCLLRLSGREILPILHPVRESLVLPEVQETEERPVIRLERKASNQIHWESWADKDFSWGGDGYELMPRTAAKLAEEDFLVVLPFSENQQNIPVFESFSQHSGSKPFFDDLKRVEEASAELEREYGDVLSHGVLDATFHGPLFREIAGMCLNDSKTCDNPAAVAEKLTSQHLSMLRLLLARLSKDMLGCGSEMGDRLKHLKILNSDPHRNGQRVIAMQFEGGGEWIYKSRSVALERFLIGATVPGEIPSLAEMLNEWLDPAVPGARLPTHRIIQGGIHHGYVEKIKNRLVPLKQLRTEKVDNRWYSDKTIEVRGNVLKEDEEQPFWYSAGLLAGFALGFGICDLHEENIVCGTSVSTPTLSFHAVDLELAFHECDCLMDTHLIDLTPIEKSELHKKGLHTHAGFSQDFKLCGSSSEAWLFKLEPDGLRLMPGMFSTGDLNLHHLVQNHDGSLGYGTSLCYFLRGMVDVWQTIRDHTIEITDYLKKHLRGKPRRVIAMPTRLYYQELRKRRCREYPLSSAAWDIEFPFPLKLRGGELAQLQVFDIPYFFRYLGKKKGSLAGIRWFDNESEENEKTANLDNANQGVMPFWKIISRQTEMKVLARALADAAAYVATEGQFDLRDDTLGVRVFRNAEDPRVWLVALLRDSRLICRSEGEGGLAMWVD